ncbi:MAG: hypothetical protein LBN27_09440, partial [Prevotellaceae bacterium]|nr:hypothetical protein [Prevotellaceae bacterium]
MRNLKAIALISVFILLPLSGASAQTYPCISITQTQTIQGQSSPLGIAGQVSTGPIGSQNTPSRLDFGYAFTIKVDVAKGSYSGKLLFLYMQDTQNGSGATNNWWLQGVPVMVPSLRFTYSSSESTSTYDRYVLTINTGDYPILMNAVSYWNSLPDGSVIRPSFYIGFTQDASTYANWGDAVINFIDVWGYKNRMNLSNPPVEDSIVVELNQYEQVNRNLEDMLISQGKLPAGTYSWYMNDEYGVSPYTYLVNNPNAWQNNIYQDGFKPWINTTHIGEFNMSNLDYWSMDSHGNICYTLYYYAIPRSLVPNGNGYVPSATFNTNAYAVTVKIKPLILPPPYPQPPNPPSPLISNAVTIASQNYGSAAASTQWGAALPAGETNYNFANGNLPGDGQYSIAQDILGVIEGDTRPIDWYVPTGGAWSPAKKYDHTSGDGSGFMYIANADEDGGIFYQKTFDVCQNMNLQFSMWLFNICDGTRQNTSWNSQYRIKPNVHIQIYEGNWTTPPVTTPLLDYYTGEVPMIGQWEQYFTPIFNVPTGVSQISVFFLSVNDGGNGNDFMIDDIQVQRSNGAFNFSEIDITQCLSSNDDYEITADWDTETIQRIFGNNPPSTFYYQWTFYDTTNLDAVASMTGSTPVTINGSPTSGTVNYPADNISLEVKAAKVGIYKVTVAATAAELDEQCSTFSYYVFSPPILAGIEGTSNEEDICAGMPITLTINSTETNIPEGTKVLWYMQPDGKPETPLLDSKGDQISGLSVEVTPTRTTTYIAKLANCSQSLTYTIKVGDAPTMGFGAGNAESGYTRRVCYSADSVHIPITYNSGTGTLTYLVFLDSIGNASPLAMGSLASQGATGEIIIENLNLAKPSLDNFRHKKERNTVSCAVVIEGNTCNSVQYFNIRFISDSAVWLPAHTDNWNNDANWYITDQYGNRYAEAGVPMGCTNVVIPGNATNFPVLKAATDYGIGDNLPTDDGFTPQPKCNSITFQLGGEVAQIQHLDYLYAFVDLNFGRYDGNKNFANKANLLNTDGGNNYYPYFLARDRYYSMTAPLKEMYAGDFAFAGRPNTYMKYIDTLFVQNYNPSTTLINRWSNSVNSYDVPFGKGFGFAYQVANGKADSTAWPYNGNQDYLNSVQGLVRFPYYNNAGYLSKINPRHTYTPSTPDGDGTSTFSYFYAGYPMWSTGKTNTATRSSVSINNSVGTNIRVPKGNRFIVENENNEIPDVVSITPSDNRANTEILLGNPLMSHIDFGQLYVDNSTAIDPYCRIWTGSSAQYYSILVNGSGTLIANTNLAAGEVEETATFIAPMQSFLVKHLTTDPINFNLP